MDNALLKIVMNIIMTQWTRDSTKLSGSDELSRLDSVFNKEPLKDLIFQRAVEIIQL